MSSRLTSWDIDPRLRVNPMSSKGQLKSHVVFRAHTKILRSNSYNKLYQNMTNAKSPVDRKMHSF